MAAYDFGGGCACGVHRWCECENWSQSDPSENRELFRKRIRAGETPPVGVFNPVEWDKQKMNNDEKEKRRINVVRVLYFFWECDSDNDLIVTLSQKDIDNNGYVVGFIQCSFDHKGNDLYTAWFIPSDDGSLEYFDFGYADDFLDLIERVEREVIDRCDLNENERIEFDRKSVC